MKRIEIDLPLQVNSSHKNEDLEVICKVNKDFNSKVAGQKLYELLMHMPASTMTELFENPEFKEFYETYLASKITRR